MNLSKSGQASKPAGPTPLWQAEPIVPTARPTSLVNSPTRSPISLGSKMILPDVKALDSSSQPLLKRFGVGVPYPPLTAQVTTQLSLGWYLAWQVLEQPLTSE